MARVRTVESGALALLGLTLSGCGSGGKETTTQITSTVSPDSCSGPTVDLALKYFHLEKPEDLVASQLQKVQDLCGANSCPTVALPGCSPQSIDAVQCELKKVFNTSVQFGVDQICAACSDAPCKICRAVCSGKEPSCFETCDQCETVFDNCKRECRAKLTTDVSGDFKSLYGAISSASLTGIDLKCSGDGISQPLHFAASIEVHFQEMESELTVHTRTAGKSISYPLALSRVRLSVALPIEGDAQCDLLGTGSIDMRVGAVTVSAFDFDVDSMQEQLQSVGAATCVDLPICRNALDDPISNIITAAVRAAVKKVLPAEMGRALKPILQGVLDGASCSTLIPTNQTFTV